MIRDYELGLVINPTLSEEQLENQFLRIGQTIEHQGGEIVRLDRWGRRRLSYSIEHQRDGYYAFINMRLDSRAVREIDSFLGVQEGVMRHLITFVDPRVQAERKRREQETAARIAAQAAQQEADRAAFAAALAQAPAPTHVAVIEQAPAPTPADVEAAPTTSDVEAAPIPVDVETVPAPSDVETVPAPAPSAAVEAAEISAPPTEEK